MTSERHLDSSLPAPAKVRDRENRMKKKSLKLRGKGARRGTMEDEFKEKERREIRNSDGFMELKMVDLTSYFEHYYNMLTCSLFQMHVFHCEW